VAERKENIMGTMPVNRLLMKISLPIMASMLVQALYNVVDSVFVARIGEDALTAVSLAFPLQNVMIAIGTGTGVGINALLSKSLGERNYKEADNAALNGLFLAVLSWLVFLVFGLLFSRFYFETQTSDTRIIAHGVDYLMICTVFSFGLFGQITLERLLQSTGKSVYAMISQGAGAIINIILDPIMIFGYFGFPPMGVAGAAIATVIGQTCGMLLGIWFNVKKNSDITLRLRGFRPKASTIKRIYAVGLPAMAMGSLGSVMVFGMNRILLAFSTTAAAVLGVYFKLQSFIFMPVFGLNNGIVPILSFNYGARRRDRMSNVIKQGILYAVIIMTAGMLLFLSVPGLLLSLFKASPEMSRMGSIALRIICVSFPFAGFCIVCTGVFQALGQSMLSLMTSVARQLIVLLPVAYLLSRLGNVDLVWIAFPIAEIMSLITCAIFLRKVHREVIEPIPEHML